MPLRLLKLALKAKDTREVSALLRVASAVAGLFVLTPVLRAAFDPVGLEWTDWVGVAVFTGVGGWLLLAAARGRWA